MKTLNRITTGLSIVILAVCCFAFIVFGISATGWKALSIPTSSMRPTIPTGSLVLVHRVPVSSLRIGDVITYINPLNPKTTLSHRIVKKYLIDRKVPGFVTKGDANKTDDVPITEGSIQGKVIWHIPNVGNWLIDAKRPLLILPIVYAATLVIMVEEAIRLRDYFKLNQPYLLFKNNSNKNIAKGLDKKVALVFSMIIAFTIMLAVIGPTVFALLHSNNVSLVGNQLIVSVPTACPGSTTNKDTVVVNNSNSQSATSGDATNSSGGTTNSGNASNNSSTSVNVVITNC